MTVGTSYGLGVPKLMEKLSVLCDDDLVTLTFTPPPAGEHIRWRVYRGAPMNVSTATIGEGKTPRGALAAAFENVVMETFDGGGVR